MKKKKKKKKKQFIHSYREPNRWGTSAPIPPSSVCVPSRCLIQSENTEMRYNSSKPKYIIKPHHKKKGETNKRTNEHEEKQTNKKFNKSEWKSVPDMTGRVSGT
jgi:hypothetical protein